MTQQRCFCIYVHTYVRYTDLMGFLFWILSIHHAWGIYASQAESINLHFQRFLRCSLLSSSKGNIGFSTTVSFCISHSSDSMIYLFIYLSLSALEFKRNDFLRHTAAILLKKDKDVPKCENFVCKMQNLAKLMLSRNDWKLLEVVTRSISVTISYVKDQLHNCKLLFRFFLAKMPLISCLMPIVTTCTTTGWVKTFPCLMAF